MRIHRGGCGVLLPVDESFLRIAQPGCSDEVYEGLPGASLGATQERTAATCPTCGRGWRWGCWSFGARQIWISKVPWQHRKGIRVHSWLLRVRVVKLRP